MMFVTARKLTLRKKQIYTIAYLFGTIK